MADPRYENVENSSQEAATRPMSLAMWLSLRWSGVSAGSDTRVARILPHWDSSPTECINILQSALWLTSVSVQLRVTKKQENTHPGIDSRADSHPLG